MNAPALQPEIDPGRARRLTLLRQVEAELGEPFARAAGLIKTARVYRGRKVSVVLCGRNSPLDRFLAAVASLSKL